MRMLVKVLDTEMADSKKGPKCEVTFKSPGDKNPFVCTVWASFVKENHHLIYEQNVGNFLMCDIDVSIDTYSDTPAVGYSFGYQGMAVPFNSFIRQEAVKITGDKKQSSSPVQPASKSS